MNSASLRVRYRLGMWIGLASILMLFAAFTSAYIYRQGLAGDWQPIRIPGILWIGTVLLIASSVALELARRGLARGEIPAFQLWLSITALLGIGFLFGQITAWRQLAASGIYLASNPNSSFFYLLTGAHGVHLLGGVIALGWITLRAWRRDTLLAMEGDRLRSVAVRREAIVDATALYWHFMDALWIYLFALLLVWR